MEPIDSGSRIPADEPTESNAPKRLRQEALTTFLPKKISAATKKKLDGQLLKLFTLDFQPFSIVEDTGFKDFVTALNPSYELPSRKTISKALIPTNYQRCLINSKEAAKTIKSTCLTTDCWTGRNTQSFMAVTAHYITDELELTSILLECCNFPQSHTSKNLASELRRISIDWEIENKVLLCVSDNAANIKNAITNELEWKHFGCYAHTLNLIVQDALKLAPSVLQNVKLIVAHFRRSSKATSLFLDNQRKAGIAVPRKLLIDVPTRWNSTFFMIQRFTELENFIRATVAVLDAELPILLQDDWKLLKQLCIILKPFEDVTRAVSGENYMTASLVIPLTAGLKRVCSKIVQGVDLSEGAGNILQALQSGLKNRLANVEYSHTLAIACFLDPRFKNIAFEDSGAAERAKKNVINLVTQKTEYEPSTIKENPKPVQMLQTEDNKDDFSVWHSYDNVVSSHQPQGTASSRAIIEVQRYIEAELLPRRMDPLNWWKQHQYNYPFLKQVVQEKCCILATSVPCERLFSKAGNILTDRRTCLSALKLTELLMLNINRKHV